MEHMSVDVESDEEKKAYNALVSLASDLDGSQLNELSVSDSSYSDRISVTVGMDSVVDFHTGRHDVTFGSMEHSRSNIHLDLLYHVNEVDEPDISFSIDMSIV